MEPSGLERTIVVTGHRPDKLWGFNLKHPSYKKLYDFILQHLIEGRFTYCISGMALGTDIVFALAVLKYKTLYLDRNIKLECAVPCLHHDCRWNEKDQKLYKYILDRADIVTIVTKEEYAPYLMQVRNEYMIDKLVNPDDELLAIWNGSKGGTGNAVRYGKKLHKNIVYINPKSFEL